MDKDSEDKILEDYFKRKVNESGFTFEDKIEKIIYDNFFRFRRNAHYIDKDQNIDRTIDFMVSTPCFWIPMDKMSNHLIINLELIIECKKIPHNAWIFSGKESNSLPYEYSILGRNNKDLEDFVPAEGKNVMKSIPYIKSKIFTANSYSEIPYKNDNIVNIKNIKSNDKDNNLRAAIYQVIKATRHRIDFKKQKHDEKNTKEKKKLPGYSMHIFQSVIIFDGKMYRTVNQQEKTDLEPIKLVKIEKEYNLGKYNENKGEIHIVSLDGLGEYLQLLKSDYKIHKPSVNFLEIFGFDRNRDDFL